MGMCILLIEEILLNSFDTNTWIDLIMKNKNYTLLNDSIPYLTLLLLFS